LTLARFLPLIPNFTDPAPFNQAAIQNGKLASLGMLSILEVMVTSKEYLVGEHLTLADIMVAIYVSRGLEWVLDAKWRLQHPAILMHFERVTSWLPVKSVIPKFAMVEHEPPIVNPNDIVDV
jgi:elongation factor 1-gamma